MIVIVDNQSGKKVVQTVIEKIQKMGFETHISKGLEKTTIGVIGDNRYVAKEKIQMLEGVEKVIEMDLTPDEKEAFKNSVAAVQKTVDEVNSMV